jgi:hypothetical protein
MWDWEMKWPYPKIRAKKLYLNGLTPEKFFEELEDSY